MKTLMVIAVIWMTSGVSIAGFHRSFQNGYPAEAQVTAGARVKQNQAKLVVPKKSRKKVKAVTNVVVRCSATTKSGSRCIRKAVPDEKFCRQHLLIEQKKAK